jgi:integrase
VSNQEVDRLSAGFSCPVYLPVYRRTNHSVLLFARGRVVLEAIINGPGAAQTAPGPAQEVSAPMQQQRKPRRARGTGSIVKRRQRSGAVVLWGKFAVHGEQRWVKLGIERQPGSKLGLTKAQAEAELRRAFEAASLEQPIRERLDIKEAGERYIDRLESLGRKKTTISDYRSTLRVHLVPFFGDRSLERIDVQFVEALVAAKQREGKAPKSISNYVGLLYSIFAYAEKRGWARSNPVALADKPRTEPREADIRYLEIEELEALIRATPDDELGRVERVLYRTAAMTGLRRGELLALRWRDVDWSNGLIRVRRNYTRGEFGTPKSRRSSRAVPLADVVAGELERRFQESQFKGDDDLVFAHPLLGSVLDASKLRKRFQKAVQRAELRPVRFHDLRHTFGTRMAAAGAPMRAIQEWMGHRDSRTTSLYAHYAPDSSQGASWAARAFSTNHDQEKQTVASSSSPV